MKTFYYYQDPGHGWIKVPKKLLIELKIAAVISAYSYERGEFAYLEEDGDAGEFFKAYEARYGVKPKIKSFHTNRQSKIRSYLNYKNGGSHEC